MEDLLHLHSSLTRLGLGHTFLSRSRIVCVFDCIYAISQNRPPNTLKTGAYPIFVYKWRIIHI